MTPVRWGSEASQQLDPDTGPVDGELTPDSVQTLVYQRCPFGPSSGPFILLKALKMDREERFPTARAMKAAL